MEGGLPKNWVEVFLYDVTEPVKTGVKNYDDKKEYFSTGSIKYNSLTIEGLYSFKEKPSRANREVNLGDVLQARMLETDKAVIVNEEIKNALFSTGFIQLRVYRNTINPRYLFHYVKSDIFLNQKNELASGTTQVAINDLNAKKIIFPLPPLPEQNRIVAKLDSLFAQLESIKTSMAKIPVLLKNFRQQVLTQAVTGKLTEEWREGEVLKDWKEKRIDEVSSSRLGKMLDKAKNTGEEFEYIGNIDVQWNNINIDNLKKIRIEEKEFEKFLLKKNDILVCEGGEAGRAAIWEIENSKIIYQKALHRIRVHNNYHPKFLLFNLEVDTKSGAISKLYTGTTIKHLTGQNLATYTVNFPPFEEQQEIVCRVESLFDKADAIEEKYKKLKAKIETLPQTILHKAFKGQLTEQLESDGDAKDLLEEILAFKNSQKLKKVTKNL